MIGLEPTTGLAALALSLACACGGQTHTGATDGGADAGRSGDAASSNSSGSGASSGGSGSGVSSGGSGSGVSSGASSGSSGSGSSGSSSDLSSGVILRPQSVVDKLDLLFMIDNSTSMGDKQALLAQAVPDMIARLVSPNCIDATGNILGTSTPVNGVAQCATGSLEFPPVHDMHLGIVTSSLGGRGASTVCDPSALNGANPTLLAHNDDRGELINRGGASETPVAKAQTQNFLAWFPPVAANAAVLPPPNAETVAGDPATPGTLIGDFTSMVSGVHEHGCGFEAQNEAWYRFLVQPDPYASIQVDSNHEASYSGIDQVILIQRATFLRPDSLLAVIVVSDETQATADPLSIGRLGSLFEEVPWPGSPTGGAPQGTIECTSDPEDPSCLSCASPGVDSNASTFPTRCPPDLPGGVEGYLDPADDGANVRFFHQKQRFGVSAGYPSTRYVTGLTSVTVPDRDHEDDAVGSYIGDQAANQNCINPIFAKNLPTDPSADLCHLTPGPRTPDSVYYAVIGGVPHQLLQVDPSNPDSPQKDQLAESDWLKITGNDPEHYDFSGADVHMLESEVPRPTGCDPTQTDSCDPFNGREWATNRDDLQFACIFDLAAPKDCTLMQFAGACDCQPGNASIDTPLCQKDATGAYTNTQIKGKAYPAIAELVVAHAMVDQGFGVHGIVSSLCPIHTTPVGATDPVYGYRPAMNAIVQRLRDALGVQCLPVKLNPDPTTGGVTCQILATLASQGPQTSCNNPALGLSQPSTDVLSRLQTREHLAWLAAGGASSGSPDPSTFPTCLLTQLTPDQNPGDFAGGGCSASIDPGWCYVEGTAAGACPQQILFSAGEPPAGATLILQCAD
jgi:hypothetical protein